MTLGDFIKSYRTEHSLSMSKFGELVGISDAYVCMLEKNQHPKTKQPIIPTIKVYSKIASAVGLTTNDLLALLDDAPVSIDYGSSELDETISSDDFYLLELFHRASPSDQDVVWLLLKKYEDTKQVESREIS